MQDRSCARSRAWGANVNLHAKFGDNRNSGSRVMEVFVNFKMAAGHLGL